MLQGLRQAPDSGTIRLSTEFLKDINWFVTSLSTFNGVVMFPYSGTPQNVIFVDSSLYAFGGVMGCQAYHLPLPDHLAGANINFLELLNIHVAL